MKHLKISALLLGITITFFLLTYINRGEATTIFQHHQQAVLISPTDNLLVAHKEFQEIGIRILSSPTEFNQLEQNEDIKIIYIHPDAITQFADSDLQRVFEAGKIIVALNTPISVLAKKVDEHVDMKDMPPQYYARENYFTVSIIQSLDDPANQAEGLWVYSEFYTAEHFRLIVGIIESELDNNMESASGESASCVADYNIAFSANNWSTVTNTTLQGWNGTKKVNDPINGGYAHQARATSIHYGNYGTQTAHYISARVGIWNNCDWVHEVTNKTTAYYNASTVCNVLVQTRVSSCSRATFWSNTQHSIKPTVSSYWTSGSINSVRLHP